MFSKVSVNMLKDFKRRIRRAQFARKNAFFRGNVGMRASDVVGQGDGSSGTGKSRSRLSDLSEIRKVFG